MSWEQKQSQYRFVLFLGAGGLAALVNILSRTAFSWVMSYEVAIIAAYVCGMTIAYALNRAFVFAPSRRTIGDEYLRFAFVNSLAIVQVLIISVGLAHFILPSMGFTWHAETVAHVIGVAAPVFTSYIGHKHFSFSEIGSPTVESLSPQVRSK